MQAVFTHGPNRGLKDYDLVMDGYAEVFIDGVSTGRFPSFLPGLGAMVQVGRVGVKVRSNTTQPREQRTAYVDSVKLSYSKFGGQVYDIYNKVGYRHIE